MVTIFGKVQRKPINRRQRQEWSSYQMQRAGPPSGALDREGHVGVSPLPGLRADGGPVSGHVLPGSGQATEGAGQDGWQRHQAGLGLIRCTALYVEHDSTVHSSADYRLFFLCFS